MKKITFLSCLAVSAIALSSAANAKNNMGGYTGPGAEVTIVTVEQAKGMNDEAIVFLQGNIQKKIGDELYIFTDKSGAINVEIDDEDWNGMNIAEEDLVQIKGEVDKGWVSTEIDVEQINKVNP